MWRLFAVIVAGTFSTDVSLADGPTKAIRLWDFEDDGDQPVSGFRAAMGTWGVVQDGNNRVLAQTAQSADSVFNLALRPDVLYADLELSVRLKAVKGVVDQGGGWSGARRTP